MEGAVGAEDGKPTAKGAIVAWNSHIGERGEVLFGCETARLEAVHPAGEAASDGTALPLAIQRIAISWRSRPASFMSSEPALRSKTDGRDNPAKVCGHSFPCAHG